MDGGRDHSLGDGPIEGPDDDADPLTDFVPPNPGFNDGRRTGSSRNGPKHPAGVWPYTSECNGSSARRFVKTMGRRSGGTDGQGQLPQIR
jgi:hypothetical protein